MIRVVNLTSSTGKEGDMLLVKVFLVLVFLKYCNAQFEWMYHQEDSLEGDYNVRSFSNKHRSMIKVTASTASTSTTERVITVSEDHGGVLEVHAGTIASSSTMLPTTSAVSTMCPINMSTMTMKEIYQCIPVGMHLRFNNLTQFCSPCPLCRRCRECAKCVQKLSVKKCNCICARKPIYQSDQSNVKDSIIGLHKLELEMKILKEEFSKFSFEWHDKIDEIVMGFSSTIHRQLSSGIYQLKQLYKSFSKRTINNFCPNVSTIVHTRNEESPMLTDDHHQALINSTAVSGTMSVVMVVYGIVVTYGAVYYFRRYKEVLRRQQPEMPGVVAQGPDHAAAAAAFQPQDLQAPGGEPGEAVALQPLG